MTDTNPPPIDMTDEQLAEAMRDELQHYGADTWTPALYFEAAWRLASRADARATSNPRSSEQEGNSVDSIELSGGGGELEILDHNRVELDLLHLLDGRDGPMERLLENDAALRVDRDRWKQRAEIEQSKHRHALKRGRRCRRARRDIEQAAREMAESPPVYRDYTGTDERTCAYCGRPLEIRGPDNHREDCRWDRLRRLTSSE